MLVVAFPKLGRSLEIVSSSQWGRSIVLELDLTWDIIWKHHQKVNQFPDINQ